MAFAAKQRQSSKVFDTKVSVSHKTAIVFFTNSGTTSSLSPKIAVLVLTRSLIFCVDIHQAIETTQENLYQHRNQVKCIFRNHFTKLHLEFLPGSVRTPLGVSKWQEPLGFFGAIFFDGGFLPQFRV